MLYFVNDYCEGAHPAILQKLLETNMEKLSGYGTDKYCDSAKEKIRKACSCPDAEVYFLVGGTQTNATIIASVLNRYEGVLAAQTIHRPQSADTSGKKWKDQRREHHGLCGNLLWGCEP